MQKQNLRVFKGWGYYLFRKFENPGLLNIVTEFQIIE